MEDCWPFGIVLWGTVSNRHMRRWLKTGRRERCGKGALDASGGGEGDDHCLRVESIEVTSEPGYSNGSGRSLAGAHVLARRVRHRGGVTLACGFRRELGKASADTV